MIIYKTTNIINNKIYIGQTNGNKKNYIGSGKLLERAINCYGKENFKNEIILICEKDDVNYYEKELIKLFKSQDTNVGYNLSNGGEGVSGKVITESNNRRGGWGKDPNVNKKLNNHRKNNPNFGFKNKHHSQKTKDLLSEKLSGTGNYFFGKHLSKEHIEKRTNTIIERGSLCGKNNGMFGRKHTQETIEKIKLTKKLKRLANEHSRPESKRP